MDWTQIFIAIIIPLIVSSTVWMLTYIIPYIMPRQLSETILFFRKFQNPTDPSEIRIYITQFLKYADWKMLTAKGILEQIFERKYKNFEEEEEKYWNELKDKVESISINEAIKEIEDVLNELGQPIERNGKSIYKGNLAVPLSRLLEKYQDLYLENNNTRLWRFKALSNEELNKMLNIDTTPNPEEGFPPAVLMGKEMPYRGLTIKELANKMYMKDIKIIEVDGKWDQNSNNESIIPTPETFLIEVGLKKPLKTTKNEKYKIFNNILLNFDLDEDDNKKAFSIALSDMAGSMEIFKTIINEGGNITPLKIRFLNRLKNKDDNKN